MSEGNLKRNEIIILAISLFSFFVIPVIKRAHVAVVTWERLGQTNPFLYFVVPVLLGIIFYAVQKQMRVVTFTVSTLYIMVMSGSLVYSYSTDGVFLLVALFYIELIVVGYFACQQLDFRDEKVYKLSFDDDETFIIKGEKGDLGNPHLVVAMIITSLLFTIGARMAISESFGTVISIMSVLCFIAVVLVVVNINDIQLIVTDKRVYGINIFGKRVDLPIDAISAVGTTPLGKGISVSTSSGYIRFWGLFNRDEIQQKLSKLLMDRQTVRQSVTYTPVHSAPASRPAASRPGASRPATKPVATDSVADIASVADAIKQYKELLDMGAITQEEYDKKKKELLDL